MSDHDPFDGIYDSSSVHAQPVTEQPEQKVVDAEHGGDSAVDTVYSSPYLRRQSKADLQKIASAKGLDATGSRDDMIELIEEQQKA